MRTKIFTTQLIILFLFSIIISAQDDNDVNEKIDNIKGDISKIVITTDEGDVVFEGKDAKKLFKKMKKTNVVTWVSEDDNDFTFSADGKNVMVFKSDDGEEHIIKSNGEEEKIIIFKGNDIHDIDMLEDKKLLKINVEVDSVDENKKVTITTIEDGDEKVEVYEGEEADEYLKKMKKDNSFTLELEVDSDDDHVWVHKSKGESSIEKDVKVEIVDGKKKVTVTTKENGEEKVEVFEGEEADEFLENEDGSKKHKKIIIKEIKKKDKDD